MFVDKDLKNTLPAELKLLLDKIISEDPKLTFKGMDSSGRPTEYPATLEGLKAMQEAKAAYWDSQVFDPMLGKFNLQDPRRDDYLIQKIIPKKILLINKLPKIQEIPETILTPLHKLQEPTFRGFNAKGQFVDYPDTLKGREASEVALSAFLGIEVDPLARFQSPQFDFKPEEKPLNRFFPRDKVLLFDNPIPDKNLPIDLSRDVIGLRLKGMDATGRPAEYPVTIDGLLAMQEASTAYWDSQKVDPLAEFRSGLAEPRIKDNWQYKIREEFIKKTPLNEKMSFAKMLDKNPYKLF